MGVEHGVDGHGKGSFGGPAESAEAAGLHVRDEHAAGCITLQRPSRLNALTPSMYRAISERVPVWSRAPLTYCVLLESAVPQCFCAGTDFAALSDLARSDLPAARRALADAYTLVWQLDCFAKPAVAFIDGVVIGAGVGISLYGTHRVAGERYRFSMPETAMGWIPDHGLSHVFARMPSRIGMYLALTGHSLGVADAFELGLITHFIPSAQYADIRACLSDADPVDPLLDGLHVDPGPGELKPYVETIARCFSADSVDGIIARLQREGGAARTWAAGVAEDLLRLSPTSLGITHRMVREAGTLDLRETLVQDYRIACRLLLAPDFDEGVRRHASSADGGAHWHPARLADLQATHIDRYFLALEDTPELKLLTRAEMQAVGP